jgi:hypothetical protein
MPRSGGVVRNRFINGEGGEVLSPHGEKGEFCK